MIIVKLWGGLCNQMFQYAFGYAMSKKYSEDLKFDIEFYANQPNYVDSRTVEISNSFQLPSFETTERPHGVELFQNRIISNIIRRLDFFHCSLGNNLKYVREKTHIYSNKVPYHKNIDYYYDGYWQTEEYFLEYKEDIRNIFKFDEDITKRVKPWLDSFNNQNTIAFHIRRRDMVGRNVGYSEEKTMGFYLKAVDYFKARIANPLFVIFSDDINWCKKWLKTSNEKIVFQDNEWLGVEDLAGISLCKHGIMSQSTFSWWGNWIGDYGDRIVVAPNGKYLNNKFIPTRWIKLR